MVVKDATAQRCIPVQSPDEGKDQEPRHTRLFNRADLVVYLAYLVLACWVCARMWKQVDSRSPTVNPTDHQVALWFLAHAARVVTEGVNPLFSHQLNVPHGVNLMANTSMLGLGIPMAPVTVLFGPLITFAVLLTVSLAATASAWYIVLRRAAVQSRIAAAIGAGFCGFAPGMVSHASGQLNFVAQFLLPFIVLSVLHLAQPGHGLRRTIVLAALIAYQVFINEEMLLLIALACGIFVTSYALIRWREVRPIVPLFARRLAGAGALAGIVLAFPLWFQFFGPGHYRGLPFEPLSFPADLWSYLAFPGESLGGSPAGAERYSASANEENAFFGIPLVMVCLLLGWWLWREALVRAALITGAVFAAFSLGETIIVAGRDTGIPGPFQLLTIVPLGELIVPSRFALIVVPVVGLLLALGTDKALSLPIRDKSGVPLRPVWMSAIAAALLPIVPTPIPASNLPAMPAFVSDGIWREYVAPGQTAVIVPVPYNPTMIGQTWSAVTQTEMAIPAGYYIGPRSPTDAAGSWGPPPRPTAKLLNRIALTGETASIGPENRHNLAKDLRYWRAAVVVLNPSEEHATELRTALGELLGPGTHRGGVWLWDVRNLTGTATSYERP